MEPAGELIRRYPPDLLCFHSYGLDQVDEAPRLAGLRTDPLTIHISILPEGDE